MKNYGNDGQQKAKCENFGDTVTVLQLQEKIIALDFGLTCKNVRW
jgi:hypothetical protein